MSMRFKHPSRRRKTIVVVEPSYPNPRALEIALQLEQAKRAFEQEPGRRLLQFVPRSGADKGELQSFTKAQYRKLFRREPNPAIVNKQGRVPWELSLDVLASEAGLSRETASDAEQVRESLQRAQALMARIPVLERALEEAVAAPRISPVERGETASLEFPPAKVLAKAVEVDSVRYEAIREPSRWNVYELDERGERPNEGNRQGTERYSREAEQFMDALAESRAESG